MKKTIDKKNFQIIYIGKKEELESILDCLVEKVQKELKNSIETLSKEEKNLSLYPKQRIYYNLEKIVYIPNTSEKRFIFDIMINNSNEADKNFSFKNPSYKIKIKE